MCSSKYGKAKYVQWAGESTTRRWGAHINGHFRRTDRIRPLGANRNRYGKPDGRTKINCENVFDANDRNTVCTCLSIFHENFLKKKNGLIQLNECGRIIFYSKTITTQIRNKLINTVRRKIGLCVSYTFYFLNIFIVILNTNKINFFGRKKHFSNQKKYNDKMLKTYLYFNNDFNTK